MSDHDRPTERRAPRPWCDLVGVWATLMHKLAAIVGAPPEELDGNWLAARDGQAVALTTWRWMWSLPPCSEARKAAFTAGAAAQAIERWRKATEDDDRGPCGARPEPSGHRAESLLRILSWHVDDAKGERAGIDLHGGPGPTVPRHESVYIAGPIEEYADHEGISFKSSPSGKRGAHMILNHHISRGQRSKIQVTDALLQRFGETAVGSLPDGPWVMTSRDVCRFLDMILEEAT